MNVSCMDTAVNSPNSSENGKKVRRRKETRLAASASDHLAMILCNIVFYDFNGLQEIDSSFSVHFLKYASQHLEHPTFFNFEIFSICKMVLQVKRKTELYRVATFGGIPNVISGQYVHLQPIEK